MLGSVIGIVGALILMFGFIFGLQELWRAISWKTAKARIVRWTEKHARDGTAKPVFAFTHNGAPVEATSYQTSYAKEIGANPVGSEAPVRYRPQAPEVVEFLPSLAGRLWPLGAVIIGLALAIAGIKMP